MGADASECAELAGGKPLALVEAKASSGGDEHEADLVARVDLIDDVDRRVTPPLARLLARICLWKRVLTRS